MTALDEIRGEPWAMEPEALRSFAREVAALPRDQARTSGVTTTPGPLYAMRGATAVIQIRGVLLKRVPAWAKLMGIGAVETPTVRAAVEAAAADSQVRSILLEIESPGGQAAGVLEAADAIHEVGRHKRVDAVIEGVGTSGAYWLASQAHEITAGHDAKVGSIGVYQVWIDESKAAEQAGLVVHVVRSGPFKGMGEPGALITQGQLASMQAVVDGLASLFSVAVSRGRRRDTTTLATGQVWLASEARNLGLVDRVESAVLAYRRLTPTGAEMSDQKDPATEARAAEQTRLANLRAAFPRDLEFAVEQFARNATVQEAKAAYVDVLEQRIADRESAAAIEKAKAVEDALAKSKGASLEPGAPPVPHSTPGASLDRDEGPFLAAARAYASEKKCSMRQAMSRVATAQPEVFAKHVEQCQAQAPEHAARKRRLGVN